MLQRVNYHIYWVHKCLLYSKFHQIFQTWYKMSAY
jgi:hypothetical protein